MNINPVYTNTRVRNINPSIYGHHREKYYSQTFDNITQQPLAI